MSTKIVYLLILAYASLIEFALSAEKYKFISECILHHDDSYKRGGDNITFVCTDQPNPDLFRQHEGTPETIRCKNQVNDVYSFWPGIWTFEKCNFPEINPSIFRHSTYMYRVDISDMGLVRLATETFFHTPELEYLIASKNNLTEIPPSFFEKLHQIVYIDFSYNRITHINPLTFANLKSLNLLDLSRNGITTLDEHLFRDTRNLTTLVLSHNNLTALNKHTFDQLTKLKHLMLSHNHLKELNAVNTGSLIELKLLDISNNQFDCLHLNQFFEAINSSNIQIPTGEEVISPSNIRGIVCISLESGIDSPAEVTTTHRIKVATSGESEVVQRSRVRPETSTETGAPAVLVSDSPLAFNLHGIVSELRSKRDNIVVTTTLEFPKKFFSNLFTLI